MACQAIGKPQGQNERPPCFHLFLFCFFATITSSHSPREHSIPPCPKRLKRVSPLLPPSPSSSPNTQGISGSHGAQSHSHVVVDGFHGFGRKTHVLQHLGVGVRILQGLSLELDGGQRAINLRELLLKPLLSL